MSIKKSVHGMKDGIERFEKFDGQTVYEKTMRYNSGACHYELECAFAVLKKVQQRCLTAGWTFSRR